MTKVEKSVVIATSKENGLALTALADSLSENITVIAVGDREAAVNAQKAYFLNIDGGSFVFALPTIKALVRELSADIVITETSKNGRLAAAVLSQMLETSALTDPTSVWIAEDKKIYSKRMVYGGGAYKTEYAEGKAVICAGFGLAEVKEAVPCADVEEKPLEKLANIEYVSRNARDVRKINLAAAKRVVGVGRGVKDEQTLTVVEQFASAIGAEMACTRPVAEDDKLMPRERYLGVSGASIKPELYIAAGLSGQIQHMVGVNEAGTLIAVNKDKNASIFNQCDYGIVGDMAEVMKALEEKLG